MTADRLAIVQFIHPGAERRPPKGSDLVPWNLTSGPHGRKFLLSDAAYVSRAGAWAQGLVGFWGEWEPPSAGATPLRARRPDEPTYGHVPIYHTPATHDGLWDTDPCVFGERFMYAGCQQHTNHAHPDGARETFLRRLAPGSLVLFGSSVRGRFVLDTALVVADYHDYPNGEFAGSPTTSPPRRTAT